MVSNSSSGELLVEAVFAGRRTDSLVSERVPETLLDLGGMPGDRHHGLAMRASSRESAVYERGTEIRNRRQLTMVSVEECADVASRLGLDTIQPEWLGANILVSGHARLTALPAGTRIVVPGEAGLVCEGENLPCRYPGEVLQELHPEVEGLVKAFVREAYGRRGIVASVERAGWIRPGDRARVLPLRAHSTLT